MHRVGIGYDSHRLEPPPPSGRGRPLRIGGVPLRHDTGPVSHSDGDALLHAITDAILGAIAGPDIGSMFPDHDPANDGRDSCEFLQAAARLAADEGWRVTNLDAVVLLERPKIAPIRDQIRQEILRALGPVAPDSVDSISVKGKTGEGVGPVGEGRLIEAHAVVLLGRA